MDAITYIVNQLKIEIPEEIFTLVNQTEVTDRFPKPLDYFISTSLTNNVLIDLNLMRGVEVSVDLFNCHVEMLGGKGYTIRIPDEYTHGRDIVSALGLMENKSINRSNAMLNKPIDALQNSHVQSFSGFEVIEHNMVAVYTDSAIPHGNFTLRFVVGYSSRLNEINPRTFPRLSDFCVLGMKRWIYNELVMKVGKSNIYHGHELPMVNQIIDEYKEAVEEYKRERRHGIKAVLFANDRKSMNRLLKVNIRP